MFLPHHIEYSTTQICNKVPEEYVESVGLLTVEAFETHLRENYGLTLITTQSNNHITGAPLFSWNPQREKIYCTSLGHYSIENFHPFFSARYAPNSFPQLFFVYQWMAVGPQQPAVVKVGLDAAAYCTLFDSLFDLGNTDSGGFTFVEDREHKRWMVPESYFPGSLLTNFPLYSDELPIKMLPWELILSSLNLPTSPNSIDPRYMMGAASITSFDSICTSLYLYVVSWFHDRLSGPREGFDSPEKVFQVLVSIANEPSFNTPAHLASYPKEDQTLNFHFYQLLHSLTVRKDGLTDWNDPDNKIASLAEDYKRRIHRSS